MKDYYSMKLKRKHIAFFIQIMLLMGCFHVSAQDQENQKNGEVEDAEILITKDRQLALPELEKIFEKIRIPENESTPLIRPNIFKPYSYKLQKSVPQFKAAKPNSGEKDEVYSNYVKAGLGNFGSVELGARLYLPTDENKVLGLNIEHLSFANGAVDGGNSGSSKSEVGVFGKLIGRKTAISGALGFKRIQENFYGHAEIPETVDFILEKQKFNLFHVNAQIDDMNKKDAWDYQVSLEFKNVSDNYSASESRIIANSNIIYDEQFSLDLEVQNSTYKDVSELKRNYIRLSPTYLFELGDFQVDAGVSLSFQNDSSQVINNSKIFPYVLAKYPLNSNLEAFAKLDGGFEPNNYWDIINENPYVNTLLPVQNAEVNYDFELGMRGNPLDEFSFELSFGIQSIKNKGFFINDGVFDSMFTLAYLTNSTRITSTNLFTSYRINENHSLGLNLEYADYSNDIATPSHVPSFTFELNGNHKVSKRIKLDWTFYTLGGIKAFQSGGTEEKALPVKNLDISTHYSIGEKLSAFLGFSNILNQNYERYLNYVQRGFQVRAGIFYKF